MLAYPGFSWHPRETVIWDWRPNRGAKLRLIINLVRRSNNGIEMGQRALQKAAEWNPEVGMGLGNNDEFLLYDLKVEVVLDGRQPVCRHIEGDSFTVEGENLVFAAGQKVSMYGLAAVLPLLPAKQRELHPNDWMSTDAEVACPDPNCGGRFRISRIGLRKFRHSETTGLPESRSTPYWTKKDD